MEHLALVIAAGQIAAAIALLNGIVTGLAQGRIISTSIESIARQPEARGSITGTMFVGLAMAETSGIYGMVIAIILLFANPLVGLFIAQM
ncbi:MAG: ATP synthase F0 subunit C [Oscillospiraceae bacterium]|nr:ATP synthase F0 subunit C [Oscillospiraceae bacterium]